MSLVAALLGVAASLSHSWLVLQAIALACFPVLVFAWLWSLRPKRKR